MAPRVQPGVPMPKQTKHSPMSTALTCPHCGDVARCRSSKDVTETYREAYFECRQLLCGHAWKVAISFIHTIRPSATPRPGLMLTMAPREKPPLPANDHSGSEVPLPTPANDREDSSVKAL